MTWKKFYYFLEGIFIIFLISLLKQTTSWMINCINVVHLVFPFINNDLINFYCRIKRNIMTWRNFHYYFKLSLYHVFNFLIGPINVPNHYLHHCCISCISFHPQWFNKVPTTLSQPSNTISYISTRIYQSYQTNFRPEPYQWSVSVGPSDTRRQKSSWRTPGPKERDSHIMTVIIPVILCREARTQWSSLFYQIFDLIVCMCVCLDGIPARSEEHKGSRASWRDETWTKTFILFNSICICF